MIDTDKYEGHNMHSALLDVGEDYNNWDALQDMGFNDEARQLIADTPLILQALIDERAEVEMLRERLMRAYDWVEKAVHGDDELTADYTEYVCGGEEE